MDYLKSALALKQLINDTNQIYLDIIKTVKTQPNFIILSDKSDALETIAMDTFSNDFVTDTLEDNKEAESFVITDIASQEIQGKKLHYCLYKAYSNKLEKGLVYYQIISPETGKAIGDLQFSNLEENIFFEIKAPDFEESSCNAMETGEQSTALKNIAFLIGHIKEERLVYDIERLIVDTINNVQKNPKVQFNLIVQVSVFGGEASTDLMDRLKEIQNFIDSELAKEYTNATFSFEIGE